MRSEKNSAFDISIPPHKVLENLFKKKKGIDIGCLISHSKLRIYSILTYCLLVQMIKYEDYETQSLSKKKASAFCVAPWEQRGQVSMETVVLRQWESITRQYTIFNKVDNEN